MGLATFAETCDNIPAREHIGLYPEKQAGTQERGSGVQIRNYRGTDAPAVVALWNETMVHHPVHLKTFVRKVLLDVNFDRNGFFLAEKDNVPVGFAYAVRRRIVLEEGCGADNDRGFIAAMGFRNGPDFSEVGAALLKRAEEYINRDGKKKIVVSAYTPENFYQGICRELYPEYAKLLEENGYTAYSDSASMRLELDAYQPSPDIPEKRRKLEEEDFYIGALRHSDIPALFDFVIPGWRFRYRRLLREEGDLEKVRVAVLGDRVVGCNMFGDPYDGPETFNCFGVDADFRGKGLGKILLADCLTEMKNRGLHTAWIQWAHYLDAAGAVYRKAGFLQTGIYVTYIKE
ncbi:MAG: GNAT family N-acetyltransferase [Ruminococcaceae bacterium]|nr:GNAT family N-acetyltransferase [Oscillospiraceae bacterium]